MVDLPLDREATLRLCPLFTDFTDVGLRIYSAAAEQRTVRRGTYAFRAGEPSDSMGLIGRGTLQLLARDGGGAIGELDVGDSFGNFALVTPGSEHLMSGLAAVDTELLVLTRAAFDTIRREKPQAALKLMLALVQDFGERLRDAKAPLREFLAWQVSRRQEGR